MLEHLGWERATGPTPVKVNGKQRQNKTERTYPPTCFDEKLHSLAQLAPPSCDMA